MAIVQGIVTSFRKEILQGYHVFTSGAAHTFKMALYSSSATLDITTTAYTSTGEVSASGYTAGGKALVIPTSPSYPTTVATTAFVDFNDVVWPVSAITGARGALIYNSTPGGGLTNPAVVVLDFGADKASASGDFTVVFALPDALNAVVRIA